LSRAGFRADLAVSPLRKVTHFLGKSTQFRVFLLLCFLRSFFALFVLRQASFPAYFNSCAERSRIGIVIALLNHTSKMKLSLERVMKQPVIKFEPVHWWILLIALLVGVLIFFALHMHAY
jgi:hypothetical protein